MLPIQRYVSIGRCFGLFSWAVSFQLLRSIGNSSLAYLTLNIFLSGFTFHGYLLSSMLLTLNRFSCIAFPLSFNAAWTNKRCYMYMGLIVAVTFMSVSYRVTARIEVEWLEDYKVYQWLGYPRVIHSGITHEGPALPALYTTSSNYQDYFASCYSNDMFHSVLCEPYSQYLDIRELEKAQAQCIVNYLPHPEKSIHLLNYMFCFLDDHLSTTANSESCKVLWKSAFGHLSFQPGE
ncbi:hypothetical protein GCK32_015999 [Trichostrongylus colubriformis]|uniref:Serpentine receptor class gamma n=1 Tax=Trichostrongylus colubriformis TaxID=6319 RepID=A0AAN8IKS6_TRICO